MKQNAQGAMEYLLLLAAAVVVVAVVISYMISILNFGGETLSTQTLDGLCGTAASGGFDTNSLLCGCYLKDSTKGSKNQTGELILASPEVCPEKLPEKFQKERLLNWN